ncbi:peptidase [Geomicrobium sp. JCM 19037]|uniref:M23 family metallopeptidase n=1 Tax=Geomicrobium sp. JCM 19037 TaxID=1460634 RepID=UPI00045F1899|nr:M23 family metallopeptidase [Geomicrobium sp. JCM 19037]GAK06029.1 peptidase [Geomicrobium sp. JCM 19037]
MRDKISSFMESSSGQGGSGFPGFRRTSGYGWRVHPVYGTRRFHGGVDFAAPMGTPIPSQSAGRVSFSGWSGGFGNLVRVLSGAVEHYYAHNMRNLVRPGQSVSKGQTVALVGSTGVSTGPHVHYEQRVNGQRVKPPGYATGSSVVGNGHYAIVGEQGPELMWLGRGNQVHSNSDSKRIANGSYSPHGSSVKDGLKIIFAPKISMPGGSGENEIQGALRMSFKEFERMLDRYFANKNA